MTQVTFTDGDDSDWSQAFYFGANPEVACPGMTTATDSFGIDDVAELLGHVAGANDESPWFCYGRLRDGRFFHLSAWCDYTGWD